MKKLNTSSIVLDCSLTLAWILPGELDAHAKEILFLLKKMSAKVPTIWSLEVSNVLWQAERKQKITDLEVAEFKEFLIDLPIIIDESTSIRAMGSIYLLAKTHQLTTYDAAYLELAARENLPLATLDKALQKAARQIGVVVL